MPSAAAPGNSAIGDVAAEGSGPTVAFSDHKHGRESAATIAAAVIDGTAGDITTTQPGDTAAAGAVGKAADSGHKHGHQLFAYMTSDDPLLGSSPTIGALYAQVIATSITTASDGSFTLNYPHAFANGVMGIIFGAVYGQGHYYFWLGNSPNITKSAAEGHCDSFSSGAGLASTTLPVFAIVIGW